MSVQEQSGNTNCKPPCEQWTPEHERHWGQGCKEEK